MSTIESLSEQLLIKS